MVFNGIYVEYFTALQMFYTENNRMKTAVHSLGSYTGPFSPAFSLSCVAFGVVLLFPVT